MSKPLFIIRIPASADAYDIDKQMYFLEKKLIKDYYLIPVRDSSVQRVEFECYNADNAQSKDIEEIKKLVLKTI
jgi:hypothetical protein